MTVPDLTVVSVWLMGLFFSSATRWLGEATAPLWDALAGFFEPIGAWLAAFFAPLGPFFAWLFASVGAGVAEAWGAVGADGLAIPWWTVALVVVLVLRAFVVLGRGPAGAAWRTVLAVIAGGLVVGQLAFVGPDLALLPLHAVAAVTVALVPWERPHPEAAPLKMGRRRRRSRRHWPRMMLLLAATAAAAAAVMVV